MKSERFLGLGRAIERDEQELQTKKRLYQEALAGWRELCTHPTAVQIARTWTEALGDVEKPRATAWRFCLACGESEHGSAYVIGMPKPHFQFRFLEKSKIVRDETFQASEAYCDLLGVFQDRLHQKGMFDEFDAKGVWLGGKNGDERVES